MQVTGNITEGQDVWFNENEDLKALDQLAIGDWLHLERMDGTNKRTWALILTNEKGENLNITIVEREGKVIKAFIFENEGWKE